MSGILHFVDPYTGRWTPISSPQTVSYQWTYDAPTTMTDPGPGKLKTDTAVGVPSTQIAFDSLSINNIDAYPTLMALGVDDLIYFQQANDAANWGQYRISAKPTVTAGWTLIPVELITAHGTINKNQSVLVRFTYIPGEGPGAGSSSLFVMRGGDTMTGALATPGIGGTTADMVFNSNINGNGKTIWGLATPTAPDWVANKGYVDTQRDTRLATAGGKMTGHLTMDGQSNINWEDNDVLLFPTAGTLHLTDLAVSAYRPLGIADGANSYNAATKGYVDGRHGVPFFCSVQRDTDVAIGKDVDYKVAWESMNTDANQRAYGWNSNGIYVGKTGVYVGAAVVEVRQGSLAHSRCTVEGMINAGGFGWGVRESMGIPTGYFRHSVPIVTSLNNGDYVGLHVTAHDDSLTLGFARLILTGPVETEEGY